MKLSKYNILCQNEKGEYILYNTLTDNVCKISEYESNAFKNSNAVWVLDNVNTESVSKWKQLGFLVDDNYEEMREVEYEYGKRIYGDDELQLTLLTTNACNFDCIYCYQNHLCSYMKQETSESILKYIDNQLKRNYKKLYISWFGGEPLLTKMLIIEMSKEIKEIARKNKVAYFGQMTTNGYELDLHTFQQLIAANILSYSITIDGIKNVHNSQRPHRMNRNSYERIMQNCIDISKNVKTNRFTIDIRVNLSVEGIEHFLEFALEFKKTFGHDNRFHLVPEPIKDWSGPRIDKVKDKIIANIKYVYNMYEKLESIGIHVSNFYNFQRINHLCVAPFKNGYVIDWDGNVHKCDMDIFRDEYYDKNIVGRVTDTGNMELNENKVIQLLTRNVEKYKCTSCVLYPKCMGVHCIHALQILELDECPIFDELYEFACMAAKMKILLMKDEDINNDKTRNY